VPRTPTLPRSIRLPLSKLASVFILLVLVVTGPVDALATDQNRLTGTVQPPSAPPPPAGGIQVANMIGRVNMDGRGHCTGTLVGDNLVLTASHCLWDKKTERWYGAQFVHFVAGYSQYGFAGHSKASQLLISRQSDPATFLETTAFPNDWAVMILEKPLGKELGHVDMLDPQLMKGELPNLLIMGYRRDRAHALTAERNCVARQDPFNAGLFLHNCQGTFGVSGGPLMGVLNRKPILAGVVIGIIERDGKQFGAAINHTAIFNTVQALRRGDMAAAGKFARLLD